MHPEEDTLNTCEQVVSFVILNFIFSNVFKKKLPQTSVSIALKKYLTFCNLMISLDTPCVYEKQNLGSQKVFLTLKYEGLSLNKMHLKCVNSKVYLFK